MRERIKKVFEKYREDVVYGRLNSGLRFGCDCGCGGDYYSDNPDAWDELLESDRLASESYSELVSELGISESEEESLFNAFTNLHDIPVNDPADPCYYYIKNPEEFSSDLDYWSECEAAADAVFLKLNL